MARTPLPLNALRAFEAAARQLSFTRAAEELHVTQAAVSHQVKALEKRLGVVLFRRLPRSLLLTDEGQALLPELRDAFERLARALDRVGNQSGQGALTVSSFTTFSLAWLVPRLPRFQALHPEIEVRLMSSQRLIDFAREDIDIAVRNGDGNWPGLATTKLFDEDLTPLCGRRYRDRLRKHEDVAKVPLLDTMRDSEWAIWLKAAGLGRIARSRGAEFDSTKIAVQAAIDGLGVAIGSPSLFAEDIAAGRLFQPFDLTVKTNRGYWLVYPEPAAERRKIRAFRDWIVAEAQASESAPPKRVGKMFAGSRA
ncbi:MAG TPA: transcriptional regulator GcvA [Stellaceae bacterium]|nr:transcriptional regulator GcvA [Stellaceae bacterium]